LPVKARLTRPPCVTAAAKDKNNCSRREQRSLRWVSAGPEIHCDEGARSALTKQAEEKIIFSGIFTLS